MHIRRHRFFKMSADKPQSATILIDQAQQVPGWERARDLEAKTSLGLMTASLKAS